MASKVEICNRGLQLLGANSITSLEGNNTEARECSRVFDIVRDAELRAHPWNFARKRALLAASSTVPAFEYTNAFPLPDDFIRLKLENRSQVPVDWQIEMHSTGDVAIMTDDGAPLKLVYIARITDTAKWDPLFVEVFAARLAMEICEKITASATKRQLAQNEYQWKLAEAKRTNAIERPAIVGDESPWVTARR